MSHASPQTPLEARTMQARTLTPMQARSTRENRDARSEYAANVALQETQETQALLNRSQYREFNFDMVDDMINFSIPVNWDII